MSNIKTIYIKVDDSVYEIAYNTNLYDYNRVIYLISDAIKKFKKDHDIWSWDEELSSELEITELSNLPFGKQLSMRTTTDPDMEDEDLIDDDDEEDLENETDDITDW